MKELSEVYSLNESMVQRRKREYLSKSGDFGRKRELSQEEQELKVLKKELREFIMELHSKSLYLYSF